MVILPLNICLGITTFTYSLKQVSIPNTIDDGKTVFPTTVSDPNKEYVYNIDLNINGFVGQIPSMRFSFSLLNGKFSDGKTTIKMSYDSLQSYKLHVKWDDITSNNMIDTAYTASIKITGALVVDDPTNFALQKGPNQQFIRKIASLKGQTPTVAITGSSNPPLGSKIQLTAQVLGDLVYPGIHENILGIEVNKKVKQFQWILPPNWKTVPQGLTGTITTDIGVKQIVVETDYFTQGAIQVKGVNDVGTAYSETFVKNYDRGFAFTNYPASITFGDNSPKAFSVTALSGTIYEWNVPSGWQINGQGSTLEGLNLNSVSITPIFCSSSTGKIRVRMKKDTEISGWHEFPTQTTMQPAISKSSSTIYQYEGTNFSISNLNASAVQSVNWYGGDVIVGSQNGTAFNLFFKQAGTFTVTAEVLLVGCSTPLVYTETVTVNPHRLSISGPTVICTSGVYTLNNRPAGTTLQWSTNDVVSFQPNGNTVTATKVGAGYFTLIAYIYVNGSHICNVYSEHVYVPMAHPIVMESVNRLQALDPDATLFRILSPIPAEAWRYRGQLTVRSITEYNYTWSKISPATNDVQWTANGATVDVYTRFAEKELTLKCRGVDPCGNVNMSYFTFTTKANPFIPMVMVYPNPATDIVTIELKTDEEASEANTFSRVSSIEVEAYSIQLWNEHHGLVRTLESKSSIQQLSLSGLPAGMYFVVLSKNGEALNRQIIWKKQENQ